MGMNLISILFFSSWLWHVCLSSRYFKYEDDIIQKSS